jgi:hypothetical protein
VAIGTSVTFNVTLLIDGKIAENNRYLFRYEVDFGKRNSKETHSPSTTFTINVEELSHGFYKVKFTVEEFIIFTFFERAQDSQIFSITNRFNGLMQLTQTNDTVRDNGFVSSASNTTHNIIISDKDRKFYNNATYIRVFWFVDCQYLGKYCDLH